MTGVFSLFISYAFDSVFSWVLPALLVLLILLAAAGFLYRYSSRQARQSETALSEVHDMMERSLRVAGNNVIVHDVRRGVIRQLSGQMLPPEGITVDEFKRRVHPDDVEKVVGGIGKMVKGEVPVVDIYYCWNFNAGGGEPQWRQLHSVSLTERVEGSDSQVNVISTLVDETDLLEQQRREEELTNKYKLIFEHSIIGLSFYTPDGWLLNANANMRRICNFDSEEGDAFFSSVNLFDMSPFNEVLDRHHVEEYWACSQSIIPERNMHVYLEIRIHPIVDDEGRLAYISIAARDVTEEREMYLQARHNDQQIQKAKEAIQLYEQELRYMMDANEMEAWRISLDRNVIEFYRGLSTVERSFPLDRLSAIFADQDDDFVKQLGNPAVAFSHPLFYIGRMNPIVTGRKTEQQWVQINSIPEYDKEGRLLGSFGVWRNIQRLMQKQEQLKRETERANDSGRMKSVFLANMSHEIRTPLNAIVGFSDLLQAVGEGEERQEMLRIIHNNCDMLLRLINDILVMSNVDANSMQMVPEEVDFAKVFDDVCQSLAQRVVEPGVEFLCDNPCGSLIVSIDKNRIVQVITNFVTNAVKYTHEGHIRLGYRLEMRNEIATPHFDPRAKKEDLRNDGAKPGVAEGDSRALYVYCEDTGAGIPEDQRSRIFERFVKLNDYIQGTGLGLSICKAIIDRCGGEIGVDSEVGKGSTFWFKIPLKGERLKS